MSTKGYKHSEETKQKMREKRKFQIISEETRKKMSETRRGKKRSEETRRKISLGHKGIVKTPEWRKKLSESHKGERAYNWKGGTSNSVDKMIRRSLEYKLWREAVFKRDNWTCVWCGKRGGKLNADHIKPFSLFPELRFAIDNGRTLCVDCHRKTDTYGKQIKN